MVAPLASRGIGKLVMLPVGPIDPIAPLPPAHAEFSRNQALPSDPLAIEAGWYGPWHVGDAFVRYVVIFPAVVIDATYGPPGPWLDVNQSVPFGPASSVAAVLNVPSLGCVKYCVEPAVVVAATNESFELRPTNQSCAFPFGPLVSEPSAPPRKSH